MDRRRLRHSASVPGVRRPSAAARPSRAPRGSGAANRPVRSSLRPPAVRSRRAPPGLAAGRSIPGPSPPPRFFFLRAAAPLVAPSARFGGRDPASVGRVACRPRSRTPVSREPGTQRLAGALAFKSQTLVFVTLFRGGPSLRTSPAGRTRMGLHPHLRATRCNARTPPPGGSVRAGRWRVSAAGSVRAVRVVFLWRGTRPKERQTRTTLSGGSLGSCVDEERS